MIENRGNFSLYMLGGEPGHPDFGGWPVVDSAPPFVGHYLDDISNVDGAAAFLGLDDGNSRRKSLVVSALKCTE